MRWLALLWLLMAGLPVLAVPSAESVAILCNAKDPESVKLAEFYRRARDIPKNHVIALDMPLAQEISREEYDQSIVGPLRKEFEVRGWWKLGKDQQGVVQAVSNQIRVLVSMRGVPLKIRQTVKANTAPEANDPQKNPFNGHDEASVDSELALCGVFGLPLDGGLRNAYYQSNQPIDDARFPFLMLTARIDAPTYATCERMIQDAIDTEKVGLWGMAYVDVANKVAQGDGWLEEVVKQNRQAGIPTVVDRFNDTLPMNYPMRDAAWYDGWYDWSVSGPFLNPSFKFRKGAVAMHLHSFSAQQLRDPNQNWSGGLLELGAAVTIGNVYEPYLHMTHDFGLLQQRLLAGFSWVEACWMAIPTASWQAVVLGDPLYRPCRHLDGSGSIQDGDREYRALRSAVLEWKSDLGERRKQLDQAADRMKSGVLAEALGLDWLEEKQVEQAAQCFRKAKTLYTLAADQLRQDMHLIAIDRAAGRKDLAIRGLRDAAQTYAAIPEVKCVRGWLDILDPPPPPPAVPGQLPAAPSGFKPTNPH